MDKGKAIESLKQCLNEVPQLRKLHHDNQDFVLWFDNARNIIKAALTPDDLKRFKSNQPGLFKGLSFADSIYQENYLASLTDYETAILSIIRKYEILGVEAEKPIKVSPEEIFREVPPKAFIAHGGKSEALDKLKEFLVALGVEPLVVEEQASENRSIGNNVDSYARQADCAIILATKGDIDGITGGFVPRGNVLVEIGKAQELFKDRIIYLLQAGTKFPTNVSEKVWGRFTSSCMDEAFIKVARELTAFGILKAVKPPPKEHKS